MGEIYGFITIFNLFLLLESYLYTSHILQPVVTGWKNDAIRACRTKEGYGDFLTSVEDGGTRVHCSNGGVPFASRQIIV